MNELRGISIFDLTLYFRRLRHVGSIRMLVEIEQFISMCAYELRSISVAERNNCRDEYFYCEVIAPTVPPNDATEYNE